MLRYMCSEITKCIQIKRETGKKKWAESSLLFWALLFLDTKFYRQFVILKILFKIGNSNSIQHKKSKETYVAANSS